MHLQNGLSFNANVRSESTMVTSCNKACEWKNQFVVFQMYQIQWSNWAVQIYRIQWSKNKKVTDQNRNETVRFLHYCCAAVSGQFFWPCLWSGFPHFSKWSNIYNVFSIWTWMSKYPKVCLNMNVYTCNVNLLPVMPMTIVLNGGLNESFGNVKMNF